MELSVQLLHFHPFGPIFIEHLLCSGTILGAGGTAETKKIKLPW